jgi:hypothetical protein
LATGIPHLNPQATESELFHNLRLAIVDYYLNESNPQNGLIADKNEPGSLSSIAAVGMGLSVYVVAVDRGIISRADAVDRTLALLRFLHSSSPQSPELSATGYKGFYYHFLDMQTGRRAAECELSTVDTAIMMAGILTAAAYFTADNDKEIELRKLADLLYRRVDWQWASQRRNHDYSWLEAGVGLSSLPLGDGVQRSDYFVCAGTRIAHVSHRSARLSGMDLDF